MALPNDGATMGTTMKTIITAAAAALFAANVGTAGSNDLLVEVNPDSSTARKTSAEDFAAVGRLDWVGAPGLVVGASAYYGGSGQAADDPLDPGGTIKAPTLIAEGHVGYRARGFDFRGLFALSTVGDVSSLNALNGFTGAESIGERLVGWYLQGGYDVLRGARTRVQLLPYVRYERIDTQDQVPDGFSADPANDQQIVTLGAQVLPRGGSRPVLSR